MSKTSREELEREALRFFILHDYEKSSLNDIARGLGVTKGAIYHHFKGKDDLFLGAVNRMMDTMGTLLSGSLPRDTPVKTILDNLFSIQELMGEASRMLGLEDLLEDYLNMLYMLIVAIRKFPDFSQKNCGHL